MGNKNELTNFDRQVRYCVLRDIAADLLSHGLLSLSEYYALLALLSQRYLKGGTEKPAEAEAIAQDILETLRKVN